VSAATPRRPSPADYAPHCETCHVAILKARYLGR
jgi:hypothetical protein